MSIIGKVVVITGGTSGIGLCIVKKLLTYDVKHIAIFELDTASSRRVFDNLKSEHGGKVGFYPCDVTKSSLISENLDKVIATHESIDVLINNAGIGHEGSTELMIDVNLKAVIVSSYMLIDRIGKHKNGKGGTIVNIASILGLVNMDAPTYCATKHGVVSFTRTMKETYDTTGVRVVAICPGLTDTPMLQANVAGHTIDFLDMNPNKKIMTFPLQSPENVASAVANIIERGNSGDVWVSEEDKAPYAVREVDDHKSLRI